MARSLPRRCARFGSAATQQKLPKKEAVAHFPVAQNVALDCGRAVYDWRRNENLMRGDAHKGAFSRRLLAIVDARIVLWLSTVLEYAR
jgi:hypothetical protein